MTGVDAINSALRRMPIGPLYVVGSVPAGWYFWLAVTNRLGADPVKALEQSYGLLALQLLVAALVVSPLRDLTRINFLRFRRLIGLLAFGYAVCHLAVWLVLDSQLDWPAIVKDLTKRPYIIVGMAAFAMLVPLAVTSNDRMLRRIGPLAWRRLHWLAYPATALGAIHFVWLVKAWPPEPLIYAGVVALLLLYRVWRGWSRARSRARVAAQ